MISGQRSSARFVLSVVAAVLAATLLVTIRGVVAPQSAAAWPGGCDTKQKVAFIALPSLNGLEDMQAPLRTLARQWPVKKLLFRYMTSPLDTSPAGIDVMANELESRVDHLESQGYNRIGLPSLSALIAPFIHGTAGSLGGIPLQTRHPNTVFVTINTGTSATEDPAEAGNVFRLLDVPSITEGISIGVGAATGSGRHMLIVFQSGDAVSEGTRDEFIGIASDLGLTYATAAIGFNGSNFDSTDLAAAKAALDNLPAGSLVVHAVNGQLSDQYATDAGAAGIFTDQSNNGPIRHFAGNFFASSPLAVPLELGYSPVDSPSWQSTKAGFPNKYTDWLADARQKLYMEAFGFLAKCGKFHGILDGFLRFDAGGTRINKELERLYLPASSSTVVAGERIENPRWQSDQVAWNWKTVFGQ